MTWPDDLQINAYLGERRAATSPLSTEAKRWPLRNGPPKVRTFLKPPAPADLRDWTDRRVGWGVVAAETPGLTDEQKKTGSDLPEPIQALIKDRGDAPVFRFRPNWDQRFRLLRNYARGLDVAIGQSPQGLDRESIPHYLLIVGSPSQIPWELQYVLNAHYAVGRLALDGSALENYVTALRANWPDAASKSRNAVVWSVNQGPNDITGLMRDAIAAKIFAKLSADSDIGPGSKFIDGSNGATGAALIAALTQTQPGLIVTTSHGQTYPLDNPELLTQSLGLLVDQDYASLQPANILSQWQPEGAIWYAHACCSAGSCTQTLFDGLCEAGSEVDRILKGVAQIGSQVSPLPTALLGAKKPARAFIGHVEPTFDWTLRDSGSRQLLTDSIQQALYGELFQPLPLGQAYRKCYDRLGSLYTSYDAESAEFSRGGNTRGAMLRDLLCARDIQSMVILGDPTVILPPL